jgi:small subunit ribosomal protein S4
MIRKRKNYNRPTKPFELTRIKSEDVLVKKYALKNKKEVWRALAKVKYFRRRAMALKSSGSPEENEAFFAKLRFLGLSVKNTADVLDLKIENILERRLPTVVASKGLATTKSQARQMVTHKKVLIDGKAVNSPGYLVNVAEESLLSVRKSTPQPSKSAEKPVSEESVSIVEESQ